MRSSRITLAAALAIAALGAASPAVYEPPRQLYAAPAFQRSRGKGGKTSSHGGVKANARAAAKARNRR